MVIWRGLESTEHAGDSRTSLPLDRHLKLSGLLLCVLFCLYTNPMDLNSILFLSAILMMEQKGKHLHCVFCVSLLKRTDLLHCINRLYRIYRINSKVRHNILRFKDYSVT